jgi:hypothetical protein
MHVLALDGDEKQVEGSKRWGERERKRWGKNGDGTISYKTTRIDEVTLMASIDEWAGGSFASSSQNSGNNHTQQQIPILIIALHACGSLTPSILRAFLASDSDSEQEGEGGRKWKAVGMVVVGCCYNLMKESGESFPVLFLFLPSFA